MDLSVLLLVRRGEDLSKRKQGTSVTRGEELAGVCVCCVCVHACWLSVYLHIYIHTCMHTL